MFFREGDYETSIVYRYRRGARRGSFRDTSPKRGSDSQCWRTEEGCGGKERKARLQIYQVAAKVLDGKPVRVRIYTNPVERPEAFQMVTIPLKGLTLTSDAIRSVRLDLRQDAHFRARARSDRRRGGEGLR